MARIELATSPLPRECSTTELHGQATLALFTPQPYTGAGEGNRTLIVSLEGFCSTIELHPHLSEGSHPDVPRPINKLVFPNPRLPLQPNTLFIQLVEGEGFEPSKAEPSDLQSDPFDRSGTPPNGTGDYLYFLPISQFSILHLFSFSTFSQQIL